MSSLAKFRSSAKALRDPFEKIYPWLLPVVLFLLGYFLSEGLAESWRYAIAIGAAVVSIIPCVLYDRIARRKEALTYTIMRRF